MISLFGSILIAEVFFKVINYDFDQKSQWPEYYIQPDVYDEKIYFRRHGPFEWKGKPLTTRMERYGQSSDYYQNEKEVTISYDSSGFRNPENLINWDVVFIGDSFVELGLLPYEEIYTTLLGKSLNLRVKNLGISGVGPSTYNFFLKKYGITNSAKIAIMVFFAGNDIRDLKLENKKLKIFNLTGQREIRNWRAQSSFVKAIDQKINLFIEYIFDFENPKRLGKLEENCFFIYENKKVPISVSVEMDIRNWSEILEEEKMQLYAAFEDFREICQKNNLVPFLAYMPSKRRVLDPRLELRTDLNRKLAYWQIKDLSKHISDLCEKIGINFIDLTPKLLHETRKGLLTFNPLGDEHLNTHGSETVAETLKIKLLESSAFNKKIEEKGANLQ